MSDPIRILHVITSLRRGGAEQQLAALVANTNPKEFQHVVCHLRQPDTLASAIEKAGAVVMGLNLNGQRPWLVGPVFRLASSSFVGPVFRLAGQAVELSALLKSVAPDIVHTWLYEANLSARFARLPALRIPIVTSLQSPDYEPDTIRAGRWPRWKMTGLRWLDMLSARWASPTFVACSEFVAQSARQRLGVQGSRIQVIYNSVDPGTLLCDAGAPERLRAEIGMPDDDMLFLNVGRLDPQKGQSELLLAFREIAAAAPRAWLAIVGDGPLTADLRAQAHALGIDGRVRFMERRADVGAWLETADVFVFPSHFEGLPVALVEAMFKGLPCVASDIAPHKEVIRDGETGALVPVGDASALARAMLGLYHDPDRRRALGARARETAERFHIRATIPQWESLYRQLVACPSRRRGVRL